MKLLLGGSPCTHWSIAQTKNRETTASGMGWELFLNYYIALQKYKPDYFLYENNYSISKDIKKEITKYLGVEPIMINSALVSAQSRKRMYWTNIPDVIHPADKSVFLKDILESGTDLIAEHICVAQRGRDTTNGREQHFEARTDGKTNTLTTVQKDNMVVNAVNLQVENRRKDKNGNYNRIYEARSDNKSSTLTSVDSRRLIAQRIGSIGSKAKNVSQGFRVYSSDGKSITLSAKGGGPGGCTGLYACPVQSLNITWTDGKTYPVYSVVNGIITVKDKQYPIKLADGYYIIRKLTVTECKRLQTVPDDYIMPVSNTQAYKQLGNGWTVDVIAHILSFIPNMKQSTVNVLSMYDGMSCGHIALDKLGVHVSNYYATEIDKYAIQTTQANYPDTTQLGDAFKVRENEFLKEFT